MLARLALARGCYSRPGLSGPGTTTATQIPCQGTSRSSGARPGHEQTKRGVALSRTWPGLVLLGPSHHPGHAHLPPLARPLSPVRSFIPGPARQHMCAPWPTSTPLPSYPGTALNSLLPTHYESLLFWASPGSTALIHGVIVPFLFVSQVARLRPHPELAHFGNPCRDCDNIVP